MNLEQQVCSLELAKRLKELGVKQDSYFYWETGGELDGSLIVRHQQSCYQYASAFTVAELGEMLPARIRPRDNYLNLLTTKRETPEVHFEIGYTVQDWSEVVPPTDECKSTNEADARAKMLIYLIENKLIAL